MEKQTCLSLYLKDDIAENISNYSNFLPLFSIYFDVEITLNSFLFLLIETGKPAAESTQSA